MALSGLVPLHQFPRKWCWAEPPPMEPVTELFTRGSSQPLPRSPQGEAWALAPAAETWSWGREGEDGRRGGRGFLQVLTPPLPSSSSSSHSYLSQCLWAGGPPAPARSRVALVSQHGLQDRTLWPQNLGVGPLAGQPLCPFSKPLWTWGLQGCACLQSQEGAPGQMAGPGLSPPLPLRFFLGPPACPTLCGVLC